MFLSFLLALCGSADYNIKACGMTNIKMKKTNTFNLDDGLVYAFFFEEHDSHRTIKIQKEENASLEAIDIGKGLSFFAIGTKVVIDSDDDDEKLRIHTMEPGVCQQTSYSYTHTGGIDFSFSSSSNTRQFCFFPQSYKELDATISTTMTNKSRLFAVEKSAPTTLKTITNTPTVKEPMFFVAYFDWESTQSVSISIKGFTDIDDKGTCGVQQIPFFDRSATARIDNTELFTVSKPTCSTMTYEKYVRIIIGATVGAVALVVVIIITVICILKHKRKGQEDTAYEIIK